MSPAVALVHAADDLERRRLARAVVADDSVDFAGERGEVDMVQSANLAERLADPAQLKGGRSAASAKRWLDATGKPSLPAFVELRLNLALAEHLDADVDLLRHGLAVIHVDERIDDLLPAPQTSCIIS